MGTNSINRLVAILGAAILICALPVRGQECLEFVTDFSLTPTATVVAASDSHAYVGTLEGIFGVFDVSDPTQPRVAGWTRLEHRRMTDIAVSGDYAYAVADGWLSVIDVSDPSMPTDVTYIDLINANDIAIERHMLFAAPTGESDLAVYDLSTPYSPTRIGEFTSNTDGWAKGVAADGDFAYLVFEESESQFGSHGLLVVDVRDPSHPVEAGEGYFLNDDRYKFTDVSLDEAGAAFLTVWQGFACCPNTDLLSLDIRDPEHAVPVSWIRPPDSEGYLKESVAVARGFAYLAQPQGEAGAVISAIDVRNRIQPVYVERHETLGTAEDIAVSGRFVYVANGWRGLSIYRACGVVPGHSLTPGVRGGRLRTEGGAQ